MGGMKGVFDGLPRGLKQPRWIQEALGKYCLLASERFAERVAPVAQTTHPAQAGLARVLNSLCGATLSATREFGLLARLLKTPQMAAETPLQLAERNMCPVAPNLAA